MRSWPSGWSQPAWPTAIDLDWLGWCNAPELDASAVQRTYLDNLAGVAANYADAGVRRLVLAGAVRSNAVLDATRAAVPFELRVVRQAPAAR